MLLDRHQQQTGHLQKGAVCKIKYKLLHGKRACTGDLDPASRRILYSFAEA